MKITDKFLFRDKNEVLLIERALNSGKLSGTSEFVEAFEKELRKYFGAKFALLVNSGSAALHTSLVSIGVKRGDEVVVPATATIPTVMPILFMGAKPVFVDVSPDGFSFDADDLKRKLSERTKAAITVPMWGYPHNYKETQEILCEKDIPLVEDACQAHGTIIHNKKAGTLGEVGCFSTHDRKLISTGEGGFILTDNEDIYNTAFEFSRKAYFTGKMIGTNYKPQTIQAVIGMNRLRYLDSRIEERHKKSKYILDEISSNMITEVEYPSDSKPNYYALVLALKASPTKNRKFIEVLFEKGIPSDILKYNNKPIYDFHLFSKFANSKCKNAEILMKSVTTIPVHEGISERELDYIVKVIASSSNILRSK